MKGIGYLWAHLPSPAFGVPYEPLGIYSTNSTFEDITVARDATGTYTLRFFGMGAMGLPNTFAHRQVSLRESDGRRCSSDFISSGENETIGVRCYDGIGSPADGRLDLLVLKPKLAPEPASALLLAAGCALLGALRRVAARH
jgi:hypothetical protein